MKDNHYKKVEDSVVGTYQKIEDGVVGCYQKIEGGAVSAGMPHPQPGAAKTAGEDCPGDPAAFGGTAEISSVPGKILKFAFPKYIYQRKWRAKLAIIN